jgi:hypothetical protein
MPRSNTARPDGRWQLVVSDGWDTDGECWWRRQIPSGRRLDVYVCGFGRNTRNGWQPVTGDRTIFATRRRTFVGLVFRGLKPTATGMRRDATPGKER